MHAFDVGVIQARKDRERAAREELILDHAQRLLLENGFQNLNLDDLAKDQAYEFLFVLGPLLLRGGIGVPVNPIAIR